MQIIISIILFLSVLGGGTYLYTTKISTEPEAHSSAQISVDTKKCALHAGDGYLCPPDAVASFTDVVVTDTASGRTCTLSYSSEGFSFTGSDGTATATLGEVVVATHPEGEGLTIARTGGNAISLTVDAKGRPSFALLVRPNFAREQCLSIAI